MIANLTNGASAPAGWGAAPFFLHKERASASNTTALIDRAPRHTSSKAVVEACDAGRAEC